MVGAAKKAKSDAARKAASRAKKLEAGIVSVTVDFPERHRGWLREIAKSLVAGGDLPGRSTPQETLKADVEPSEVPVPVGALIGLRETSDTMTGHGLDGDRPISASMVFVLTIFLIIWSAAGVGFGYWMWHQPPPPHGICVKNASCR